VRVLVVGVVRVLVLVVVVAVLVLDCCGVALRRHAGPVRLDDGVDSLDLGVRGAVEEGREPRDDEQAEHCEQGDLQRADLAPARTAHGRRERVVAARQRGVLSSRPPW
jgi:hypothetical protein